MDENDAYLRQMHEEDLDMVLKWRNSDRVCLRIFTNHIVSKEAFFAASEKPEREHVTPYIYQHPGRYRLGNVLYHEDQSHHRWTVDQIEDFLLIENIIKAFYPDKPYFNMTDVLNILKENPEWVNINATVKQRES